MNKMIQQHIKEYRASTGLTLRRFAEELGVSHMSISYWERGDRIPGLDAVFALWLCTISQHNDFAGKLAILVSEHEIRKIESLFGNTREQLKRWTPQQESSSPADNVETDISC